ncbi:MAG TPA: molybdopterin-dependent oxidoreductase [candidate division Zixibacteria bacterium]|nr:molybdopterin-dependent oxidoreductase [candidate division Zixibacteria bacterium]
MSILRLDLEGLRQFPSRCGDGGYSLRALGKSAGGWDRVVKGSHATNCGYQRSCNFNLYVKDGIVLREEQVGNYPPPNDSRVPDPNPRGCAQGACYAQRMADPTRVKYPLKRAGERGAGRWQRLSWDQALTEIADTLIDILVSEGPQAIMHGGGTRVHGQETQGAGAGAFFEALGAPLPSVNTEIGDDHQGVAVTLGKVVLGDSADHWFYADLILIWGGNPACTNVANFHYIAEARYNGTRVVVISPDYNASARHGDLWVPVNIGTDAALALGLAQVIIGEKLYREEFVREQTDLPFLVRMDNGRLLREKDLKVGGREDAFYVRDLGTGEIVQAPRKSLALGGLVPALDGECELRALCGRIRVRPVFALLRERLDARFSPEKASAVTGVAAPLIRALARDIASAGGVVNVATTNWGKFHHGDLIERAILLVFALCGHMGRRGASFSALPILAPETSVGALERGGEQILVSAAGADPRYAGWKEDGCTAEMILSEYARESVACGAVPLAGLDHFLRGGLLDLDGRQAPACRPLQSYLDEALLNAWQPAAKGPPARPRALFQVGGNVFRRARATRRLLRELLGSLRLIVTMDWRMSTTALYSDYVLPACGWYERVSMSLFGCTQSPFLQLADEAVEPLYESASDWRIFVRLARKLEERAAERGISAYRDGAGRERCFEGLGERVTCGLYGEEDEEQLARDAFLNSANREELAWEEFRERGIAAYTALGTALRSMGNACDLRQGEPLVPLTKHTEKKEPYPTLTRRIQFYIDHDWYLELDEHLPTHKDCPKAGGDYPLQLTGGHTRWSMHSDWIDDAILLRLQRGEPVAFVNPRDAARRGMGDGDPMEVYNDLADFRVRAAVSPAVRPGQMVIYHGWENYQFEGWRHFKSVMASPMNPIELAGGYGHIRPDPFACSPGISDRDTRVDMKRAEGRRAGKRCAVDGRLAC